MSRVYRTVTEGESANEFFVILNRIHKHSHDTPSDGLKELDDHKKYISLKTQLDSEQFEHFQIAKSSTSLRLVKLSTSDTPNVQVSTTIDLFYHM